LSTHTPAADPLVSLRLFVGAATPAECRVYAEVDVDDAKKVSDTFSITGRITGPFCPYAQTLSATHEFVDRGPGRTLLAEARVPEACFWTPEFPYLYEVEIKLSRAGEVIATTRKLFGMRWFAAEGRGLLCERQPWLLGAARVETLDADDVDAFHDSNVAVMAPAPDDALCAAASRVGVLLVAEVAACGEQLLLELRRLAQWPAVVMVVLKSDAEVSPDARRAAGNLLLGQDAVSESFEQPEGNIAPWAQLVLVGCKESSALPCPDLSRGVPMIVSLAGPVAATPRDVRVAIDQLHAQIVADSAASHMDLPAGYVMDLRGAK
jgi:hypothetical protein